MTIEVGSEAIEVMTDGGVSTNKLLPGGALFTNTVGGIDVVATARHGQ